MRKRMCGNFFIGWGKRRDKLVGRKQVFIGMRNEAMKHLVRARERASMWLIRKSARERSAKKANGFRIALPNRKARKRKVWIVFLGDN